MIRRLFTDIAAIYDRMNHVLSLGLDRRWRRLAAADVKGTPTRILDLACGTGDFAFALARRFPEAEIVGVDLTPAMLEIARAKNQSSRIWFMEGDACDLSSCTPHAPFSLCSCAFGFRNFPDRRRALREARRVLAPDGELLVLEFFRPGNAALGRVTAAWLRLMAALFARRNTSAYRYLRESMDAMVSADDFVLMASEEGFALNCRRFFFPCCTCLHLRKLADRASQVDVNGERP